MRRDLPYKLCSLTFQCVVRRTCRGHIVRLVNDEDIEFSRVGRTNRKDVAKEPEWLSRFYPIDRRDQPGKRCPWIRMDAASATKFLDVFGIDDLEFEPELFEHLDTPFFLERCRTSDKDCASPVP